MNYFKNKQRDMAELMIEAVRVQGFEKNKTPMSTTIIVDWSPIEKIIYEVLRFNGFLKEKIPDEKKFFYYTYFNKKFSTYIVSCPKFEKN